MNDKEFWFGASLKEKVAKESKNVFKGSAADLKAEKVDVDDFYSLKEIPVNLRENKGVKEYFVKGYGIGLDAYLLQENYKRFKEAKINAKDYEKAKKNFLFAAIKSGIQEDFGSGIAMGLVDKIQKGSIKIGLDSRRYKVEEVNSYNNMIGKELAIVEKNQVKKEETKKKSAGKTR